MDDMMMVLEVAGEATPAPIRPRPEWVRNLNHSYIISGFCRGLSVYIYIFGLPVAMATVRECTRPWGNGGLEPRSCSRPARDGADLDVLALVDQPDALDAPDFVGIGAKPTRQDGQRGRLNGGGSPWVPCQLARPRPMWTT